MAEKFSEMITARVDLAQSLEAGFDSYLDDLAGGYGRYLAPVVKKEEPELDAGYQIVLLRRSVRRHRLQLEQHDAKVVKQAQEIALASAAIASRDAVDTKLRAVRSTCRGIYGPASLPRIGVAGLFPRGAARLRRFGLGVQSNLEKPDLGLEPQIELDLGEDVPTATAQLASQLGGELTQLGDLVKLRHQERRKVVGLRLRRQILIGEFDRGIRGIVRIAQGISRLAGRDDLGSRFRPILRRTLRKLEEQAAEEGEGAESGGEGEGAEVEAAQTPEEASAETRA